MSELPGIQITNRTTCATVPASQLPGIEVVNDSSGCNSDQTSSQLPGIEVENECRSCSDPLNDIFRCDDIIIDGDYPYTGYKGSLHTSTYTVSEDWTFPGEFIITIDNNYNNAGVCTSPSDLVAKLNLLGLGTFTLEGSTITAAGFHDYDGEIFQVNAAAAAPGGDAYINITTSSPVAILDVLGVSLVDMSENHARVADTTFTNALSPINFKYGDAHGDDICQWYRINTGGGDGYNISSSDASARGKTLATVLDGIGNVSYGYDFFIDYAATLAAIGIDEAVVSLNLCRLLIQVMDRTGGDLDVPLDPDDIDFTAFYDELEFMFDTLDSFGITMRRIQLCLEMGIQNQTDIVLRDDDYAIVANAVAAYIRDNHAEVVISADAYNVDDTSRYWDDYNAINLSTIDTDAFRQYFHFVSSLTTYQLNRNRIGEYSSVLDLFETEFPSLKCVFTQAAVKPGNPLRLKVGEGLIFSELYMNVINENIDRGDLVTDFSYYNVSRMVSGTNTIYPVTYFLQLIQGMFRNDGRITSTMVSIPESASLKMLTVIDGGVVSCYIVNPTAFGVTIPKFKIDGSDATVSVESYYGDPVASAASHYSVASGTTAYLQPYSTTKITQL